MNPPTHNKRKKVIEIVLRLVQEAKIVFESTQNPLCHVAKEGDYVFTLYRARDRAAYTLGVQTPGMNFWVRSTDTNTEGLFWNLSRAIQQHEEEKSAPKLIGELITHFGVAL